MAVTLTVAELTAYLRQDDTHMGVIDQAGAAVVQDWYDAAVEMVERYAPRATGCHCKPSGPHDR